MNGLLNAASVGWATAVLTLLALCATLIATVRIVRGPRHADRVVALDIFLAAAVALCVAASLATRRTVFLDVAIGLLIGCRWCRHVFSLLCLRIVRMPRNALCRKDLRLCAVVRIMRISNGFASVAIDAQAGNPDAVPAFAGFAGFAWVIVREGSFLTKIRYGGRERGASIASGCKPRFAGFAVCTPTKGVH